MILYVYTHTYIHIHTQIYIYISIYGRLSPPQPPQRFFGMARSFEQLAAPPPATQLATAKGPGMPVVYKASKSCGFFWEVTSGYFAIYG